MAKKRTLFIISCLAVIVGGTGFILAVAAVKDTSASPRPSAVIGDQDEGADENILPDGAEADWGQGGMDNLDEDGHSSTTSIRIQGGKTKDITFRVRVQALLGGLRKDLLDEETFLPANQEILVPVDIRRAQGMHERQRSWTTTIRASLSVVSGDKEPGWILYLAPRFVAIQGYDIEVMDSAARDAAYPYGATTPDEKADAEKVLQFFKPEERANLTFGSGVHAEKPLSETGFPHDMDDDG